MATPTLEDVARRANVSTATVSRALNTPDRVREETRLRVQEAVRELGYTPNFGGQALASRRTNTIGAVIPTMDNAIFAHALQVLEEALAREGVTLLVATSQYIREREEAQVRALMGRGVDGLVLIGAARDRAVYDLLQKREVPYLLLWASARDDGHVTIGFDNAKTAAGVIDRLSGRGHRRIVMIAGLTAGNDRAAERVRGARDRCRALGLPPLEVVETEYTLDAGEREAAKILARPYRPTALFCGNDVLAAGAIHGAKSLGLSVPSDVSIVGFDDIDLARVTSPPLSTVRVPHRRMGRAAAQEILRWTREGIRPSNIEFDAVWVERDSLGAPPERLH